MMTPLSLEAGSRTVASVGPMTQQRHAMHKNKSTICLGCCYILARIRAPYVWVAVIYWPDNMAVGNFGSLVG
jgi:hypothetical protein